MAANKPRKSQKTSKSTNTVKVSKPSTATTTRVIAKDTTPKKPRATAPVATTMPKAEKSVTTVKAVEPATAAPTKKRLSVRPLSSFTILPAAIAEFLGTFILASIVVTQSNQPIQILFGVVAIVLVIGTISGAHINPLATVAALVTRKISGLRAGAYIVAQILGAVLALSLLTNFVNQQEKIIPPATEGAQQQQQQPQPLYTSPNIVKQEVKPGEFEAIESETEKGEKIVDIRILTTLSAEFIGAVILGSAYAASQRQRGRREAAELEGDKETTSGNIMAALTLGGGYYISLVIASTAAGAVGTAAILNPATAIALEAFSNGQFNVGVGIYVITTLVGGTLGYALYLALHAGARDKIILDDDLKA